MRIIKCLSEKISDELHDASDYARLALKHKDEYRAVADTFYALSQDEMRHSMMLHEQVVRLIEEHRRNVGDPPPEMMAVYDYLHEREIEKAESVKRLQAMYKD